MSFAMIGVSFCFSVRSLGTGVIVSWAWRLEPVYLELVFVVCIEIATLPRPMIDRGNLCLRSGELLVIRQHVDA